MQYEATPYAGALPLSTQNQEGLIMNPLERIYRYEPFEPVLMPMVRLALLCIMGFWLLAPQEVLDIVGEIMLEAIGL